MKLISLFSGQGGFEEAAIAMGWDVCVTCEKDPLLRKFLTLTYPDAYHHDDVKTLTYDIINEQLTKRYGTGWRDSGVILVGGFPCQPFSTAGNRKGTKDNRYLWPEFDRLVGEINPDFVVGENVRGILSWSEGLVFEQVCSDLESRGFEVVPCVLPACGVNAPHRRERVWFVAKNTNNDGRNGIERQEKSKIREQRNVSAGNNERVSSDNEEIGPPPDTSSNRSVRDRETIEIQKGYEERPLESRQLSGGFEGLGIFGPPPDTESERSKSSEFEQFKLSESQQGEFRGSDSEMGSIERLRAIIERIEQGLVANTDNSGKRNKSRPVSEADGKISERYKDAESINTNRHNDQERNAADTERIGQQRPWELSQPSDTEEIGEWETDRVDNGNEELWRTWQNFPTQFPVRTGNDGIFTDTYRTFVRDYFDGDVREEEITKILKEAENAFHKEAIKAGGNAIVPQVALTIFKSL